MTVEQEARDLMAGFSAQRAEASKKEWAFEQIFHRLRLARVGASGIQHRVIETEAEVLVDLEVLVCSLR